MDDQEKKEMLENLDSFREKWSKMGEELSEMLPMFPQDTLDADLENDSIQVLALKKDLLNDFKDLIEKASSIKEEDASPQWKQEIVHGIEALKAKYRPMFIVLGSKLPETFDVFVREYHDVMNYVDKYGLAAAIKEMNEMEDNDKLCN